MYIWVFPKIGVPQNGWSTMENPIKMDDLGVPRFSETSIYTLKVRVPSAQAEAELHLLGPKKPFEGKDFFVPGWVVDDRPQWFHYKLGPDGRWWKGPLLMAENQWVLVELWGPYEGSYGTVLITGRGPPCTYRWCSEIGLTTWDLSRRSWQKIGEKFF